MNRRTAFVLWALGGMLALTACSHSLPQVIQVFSQVNRVYDPAPNAWTEQLSVFVQAANADGVKFFDRLHLIHDTEGLYVTLSQAQWTKVERPGEFWVGSNGLTFPGGEVPTGSWRAELVTRSGQKIEAAFQVPPAAPNQPAPRKGPVSVKNPAHPTDPYQVAGWTDDYVVWARDAKGQILARNQTVGPSFVVPPGTASVVLYSFDKNRGEGLEAGPFPVQEVRSTADR